MLLTLGAGDVDELARELDGVSAAPEGVERDYPLARLTTVRTGGPADWFARPDSERAAGGAAGLGRAPRGSR